MTSPLPRTTVDPQFLRQLAHDFRTPLSVVAMGLEALKHVRHDEQQFQEMLQMITLEGTERLKSLINDLAEEAARMAASEPQDRCKDA